MARAMERQDNENSTPEVAILAGRSRRNAKMDQRMMTPKVSKSATVSQKGAATAKERLRRAARALQRGVLCKKDAVL